NEKAREVVNTTLTRDTPVLNVVHDCRGKTKRLARRLEAKKRSDVCSLDGEDLRDGMAIDYEPISHHRHVHKRIEERLKDGFDGLPTLMRAAHRALDRGVRRVIVRKSLCVESVVGPLATFKQGTDLVARHSPAIRLRVCVDH